MKKVKILAVSLLASVLALAGCGNDPAPTPTPDPVCDHYDKNLDHKCDACGKVISDCQDRNLDHHCDVCDKELSQHKDENNDHFCNYCGEKLTDHVDSTGDHVCDICGEELPYVESVTISGAPEDMNIGESVQLSATVVALNGASDEFTWSVDEETVASIDETGLLTSILPGTVKVTATSVEDETVSDTVEIEVINKGFDKRFYENGYTFNPAFPEEALKEFLGSDSVFTPSSAFTEKGTYYAANGNETAITVVYGIEFGDESLGQMYEEMYYSEDLFYIEADEVSYTFGAKNDLYTVLFSFTNLDDSYYLINAFYKNSALYKDTKLTENEDWTEEEKLIIGERLPFFKMGEGYKVQYVPESEWEDEYILLTDNFAKYDLKDDIAEVLEANGFYYVPGEGNYQKPADDYGAYAFTVEFDYYYGTAVKLYKGACASKTYQKDLVELFVYESMGFKGEIFDMNLSAKEFLGEECAPEYRATVYTDAISISGLYANMQEFFDLENQYLEAGYKLANATGDDSYMSVDLVFCDLTVTLELYAQGILDEYTWDMYYSFDFATLYMTFSETKFTEFPSEAISQYLGDTTTTKVPGIEGTSYKFRATDNYAIAYAYVDDFDSSYYYWVEDLLLDGWIIDEVDYYNTYGDYPIFCYKDNVVLEVIFMQDANKNNIIGVAAYLNENGTVDPLLDKWPTTQIEAISVGRTNVALPIPEDSMGGYGFIQTSPLSYSLYLYGNMYADDYGNLLYVNGFNQTYSYETYSYIYTKDNLVVEVFDGMYEIRIDVTIKTYEKWPGAEVAELVNKVNPSSTAVIPEIKNCFSFYTTFDSYDKIGYLDFEPQSTADVTNFVNDLKATGWNVTDEGYGAYSAISPDQTIEIYFHKMTSGYEMEIYEYIPPIRVWPTDLVADLVTNLGATGEVPAYVGENTTFILVGTMPTYKTIQVWPDKVESNVALANYERILFANGFFDYGGYYAKPGYTLKITLTDYYDQTYENAFGIKLTKASSPFETPDSAYFPTSQLKEKLADLNVEHAPIPNGKQFFFESAGKHVGEVTVLGGDRSTFISSIEGTGDFVKDDKASSETRDVYVSNSGSLNLYVYSEKLNGEYVVAYESIDVIDSILSISPNTIEQNTTPNASDFLATVKYHSGAEGQVALDGITVDTSTLGETTAHVSIGKFSEDINVTIVEPVAPSGKWSAEAIDAIKDGASSRLVAINDATSIKYEATMVGSYSGVKITVTGSAYTASSYLALLASTFGYQDDFAGGLVDEDWDWGFQTKKIDDSTFTIIVYE